MPVAKSEKRVGDPGARADAMLGQMEGTTARYLEAIVPWVTRRFEADVAAAVVAAPEVTEGLGVFMQLPVSPGAGETAKMLQLLKSIDALMGSK
mgnify:CR=1 FL=1